MAIHSLNKGKQGEREAAKWLNETLGLNARRGVQYQGSPDSPDIAQQAIPDIHFEIKRVERLNLESAMKKAQDDAGKKLPIVLHRRNRSDWLVTVQGRDLKTLCLLIANHVKAQSNA